MKQISLVIITISTFFLITACSVGWKAPSGFAEIKRDSDQLLVLQADGLMMKARQVDNETPGGSKPSIEFWSGNMERSLRERSYHPVDSQVEKLEDPRKKLWWSTWAFQENGKSKRYMVGFKAFQDELMILEASAPDSTFHLKRDEILKFFRGTDFE